MGKDGGTKEGQTRPAGKLPRGSVRQSMLKRPAAADGEAAREKLYPPPGEDEKWLWTKTWSDNYKSEGGTWRLLSIAQRSNEVIETWQWDYDA